MVTIPYFILRHVKLAYHLLPFIWKLISARFMLLLLLACHLFYKNFQVAGIYYFAYYFEVFAQ